jgi:hypothetical protein
LIRHNYFVKKNGIEVGFAENVVDLLLKVSFDVFAVLGEVFKVGLVAIENFRKRFEGLGIKKERKNLEIVMGHFEKFAIFRLKV